MKTYVVSEDCKAKSGLLVHGKQGFRTHIAISKRQGVASTHLRELYYPFPLKAVLGRPINASLDLLADIDVTAIRDDAFWNRVEKQKGIFSIPIWWDEYVNHARSLNIHPLFILDYGNSLYGDGGKPTKSEEIEVFVEYAKSVVSHFKGKISRYEIWNEWDWKTGNTKSGSAEDYVRLVKQICLVIRSVYPGIEIIVGAATSRGIKKGFIRRIIQLGVMNYADSLSLHTYNHSAFDNTPEAWWRWMKKAERELMTIADRDMFPYYITEEI